MQKYEDETKDKAAHAEWMASPTKKGFPSSLLRLGWVGQSAKKLPDGMEKAHYLDIEVAGQAIMNMTGPKPSLEYLRDIGKVLRLYENWRPLTRVRNNVNDRDTARKIKGECTREESSLDGHPLSKAQKQVEFLVEHKNYLPHGFVMAMGDLLAGKKDKETGESIMDRRRLTGAGAAYVPTKARAPPTEREIVEFPTSLDLLVLNDMGKSKLKTMALSGNLRFNKDGSIDRRSAAVRSGRVVLREDGQIDGRSKIALESSTSSDSPAPLNGTPDRRHAQPLSKPINVKERSPLTTNSSSTSSHLKADGTPDMRYSSNSNSGSASRSGPLAGNGTSDMRYSANQSSGSQSRSTYSSGGGSSSSSGPCKADGTPDMRYSANQSSGSQSRSTYSSSGGSSSTYSSGGGSSSTYSSGGGSSSTFSSGGGNSSSSGPCKADGTPDMRYSSNR
jgi:hypothetical protein